MEESVGIGGGGRNRVRTLESGREQCNDGYYTAR